MRRAGLITALILSTSLSAAQQAVVGLHYRVISVDPIEREFVGAGQKKPVVGVFSTTYRIGGKVVAPSVFWRTLRPGDELDAKVRHHALFSIAVAADINLKR